jgi:hypothetical protein
MRIKVVTIVLVSVAITFLFMLVVLKGPGQSVSYTGAIVATTNLNTQSAAIGPITLYAVPGNATGLYKVVWSSAITRAATTSSVLGGANGFRVTYTDPNDSVVKTTEFATPLISDGANTTGVTIGESLGAYCKGGTNLQYSMGYTSSGATAMQYDISVRVIYEGP